MPASISIPGLDAGDATPGVYLYENFAAGQASGNGAQRNILCICNKTTAGTGAVETIYGPDTPVQLNSEGDMIALAGPGSEAHRMFRRITAINKSTSVYWIFVAESAGAAATGTVTISGTATGNGTHRLYVGDEIVETPIFLGDTPTTVATAIVATVNQKTHWTVTAANTAGVVTLTAKQKGPRGNSIRFQAMVLTAGITTTTSATADGFFTGGTTADSNTNVLAAIAGRTFYRIVSAADDATQLGALVGQVNTQALPITGMRQRVFAACTDTLANAITLATGINSVRCEIVWSEKSPWTPAELAANQAAAVALFEVSPKPKCNFAGFGNDNTTLAAWKVPRPRPDTAVPTRAQIKSALNSGLSPIKVEAGGLTSLVLRVTTRSLSGSTPDYRIRDSHKVTICDFYSDTLGERTALQYGGKNIGNDPPKGAPPPGADTITPGQYKICVNGVTQLFDDNGLLQNVDQIKADTIVQRSQTNPNRFEVRIPLATTDILTQFGIEIAQVA